MCFSAGMDLAAGVLVTAVGVDALRQVRRPAERPLALLPIVLGVHQLVEAFVWWGLEGKVSPGVLGVAEWVYLLIAFGVLPVLAPLAVACLEPTPSRPRIVGFVALGSAVAAALLAATADGPIVSRIEGHHISYHVDLWPSHTIVALYVLATCGALLASSYPHVRTWGAVNLAAVGGLAVLDHSALVSLWCLWAAITSVAINLHLRHVHRAETRGPSVLSRG